MNDYHLVVTDFSRALCFLDMFLQVIDSVEGNYLNIRGVRNPVLNVSSYDFLGMSMEPNIKTKAMQALDYYGCGSCGPRGFYGTIDQHLMFEDAIAKFMGTEVAYQCVISAFCVYGDFFLCGCEIGGNLLLGQRFDCVFCHSGLLQEGRPADRRRGR